MCAMLIINVKLLLISIQLANLNCCVKKQLPRCKNCVIIVAQNDNTKFNKVKIL